MTTPSDVPTKRPGMPAWAWGLVGCALLAPLPIIAAILFPVFAQAREKARAVGCMSNLRQQSLAILVYAQDYDDALPPKNAKWMDITLPYIKDDKVFHCPSLKDPGGFGYAFTSTLLGKKQSKLAQPATQLLIFESVETSRNVLDGEAAYRHKGTTNRAFADGHVKSFKQE